jgi:signal recognition particle GTPase
MIRPRGCIEQMEIWAKQVMCRCKAENGVTTSSVAFDTLRSALSKMRMWASSIQPVEP